MTETILNALNSEFREDFNIPPYAPATKTKRLLKESYAWFQNHGNVDISTDDVLRALVKNRAWYAYNNQLNYFSIDYEGEINSWQMSQSEEDEDE